MCGIAALFEPSAPPWLPQVAQSMTRLVRHRGPDGEGFVFFSRETCQSHPVVSIESPNGARGIRTPPSGCSLGLGHRRLSIVDLSVAGHQPMCDPIGDCWITFNGEVYNYVELRTELAKAGHAFHTGTDTEVIIAAWRQWGEGCLSRFNGMFAFILFDRRDRRLFVARDRFGVKPLYLWRTSTGGIAFASEIKQFTAHPDWRARLNGQRAYDFLNWSVSDHTLETLFAGVTQIRGGEFLLSSLDTLHAAQPRRWYQLTPSEFDGDAAAASQRFRELLDDSVRLRLRADVPVGSCLSGGLDSSSIVCTMRGQLGDKASSLLRTFSAYSDTERFDERSFIADVVNETGAAGYHTTPSPDKLLSELDQLAWHQDEPFGSTSIYAQWCVFRLARENGVTVMLDGQGADEALGGYHTYFGPRLAGLIRGGQFPLFWREAAAVRHLHNQTWTSQARFLAGQLLPSFVATPLRQLGGHTKIRPDFIDLEKLRAEGRSPHRLGSDFRQSVRSLSIDQLTAVNLPMLLHWEDRDSMAHGIEARLPFLDYRLVEFCVGLPEHLKINGGWTKRVLREGMEGRLPERVRLRRDKLGFATAEEVWMRERHKDSFLQLLRQAIENTSGILNDAALAKAHRILNGTEPFSFLVWRFISFGLWLRRFNVSI